MPGKTKRLLASHLRLWAGCVSVFVYAFALASNGVQAGAVLVIVLSWLLGLALGGRFTTLRASAPNVGQSSWATAISVATLFQCLAWSYVGSARDASRGTLLIANSLICYGLCKVQCTRLGCCGWSYSLKGFESFRCLPLALWEVVVGLSAGFGLLWFAGSSSAINVFWVSPSLYSACRLAGALCGGRPVIWTEHFAVWMGQLLLGPTFR